MSIQIKKHLCIILSIIIILSAFPFNVFASHFCDTYVPFECSITPEKENYQKGEEIKFKVIINNVSLNEITDMRIWLDYPQTDYYLTPGVTEHFIESCTDENEVSFRVCEDDGVLSFASKFDSVDFINSFLLKLAHAYKTLTLIYTSIRYTLQNGTLWVNPNVIEMGTAKVTYDGTEIEFSLKCRYNVSESEDNEIFEVTDSSDAAEVEIKATENSYTGLAFAVENASNFGLFAINPDEGKAFIYQVTDGKYNHLGTKTVDISEGEFYKMKVYFADDRVIGYVYDNPKDADPYPVFDINYISDNASYGVFSQEYGYRNFNITQYEMNSSNNTYTNPIYDNCPDPYILKVGKNYYLYATTDAGYGYRVSTSTDLVNWSSLGYCAVKGDIIGDGNFWAPEVYSYNGRYYMLYSTDEHLALAVADAPTGPFKKTSDSYLIADNCIDGDIFFDEDGEIYLYMAYWADSGEEVWGCKMTSDLTVIPETLTQLTTCNDDEGGVNEGPYMLKYNGKYYLTYSVNGYTDKNYAVRLAVSDSPLGSYTARGTILEKSGPIVGTGHHCFTTSPDGTELFIVYHCHYSDSMIHPRKLCIDRCKFVETEDGYTISVYGPTSTPQEYPSDN